VYRVDAIDKIAGLRCISSYVMIINHRRKSQEKRRGLARFSFYAVCTNVIILLVLSLYQYTTLKFG